MNRTGWANLGPIFAAAGFCLGGLRADAGIVIRDATVDVFSQSLSGRMGSVDGPYTDDPPARSGTSGSLLLSIRTTAGPVEPATPPHPSLPGTTGVVEVDSYASVNLLPACRDLTIEAGLFTGSEFSGMDGGSYLGSGSANFEVEFEVDHPTAYNLTGSVRWDDQDPFGALRLTGQLAGTIVAISGHTTLTPVSETGVLQPGVYYFDSSVNIYEVPIPASGSFAELGAVGAVLTLSSLQPLIPGDTDCNDCVNLRDLSALLSNFGTPSGASAAQGDADGDGDVDLGDLATLLGNFGTGDGC